MSDDRLLRVAFLGSEAAHERWARVLSGRAEAVPWPKQLPADIDAAILANGVADHLAQAREALEAGIPLFSAGPFLLTPWQARALSDLALRRRCLLRFAEPFRHRPGYTFLRRLLGGDEPFWRPLYLRSLRLAPPGEAVRIDDLATEELASCDALLDSVPLWVSATSSGRRDGAADCRAVFLTVQYRDGPQVQHTISLAEASRVRQLVAVTPSRTFILDDQAPAAPLRIVGGEQDGALPASKRDSARQRNEAASPTVVQDPLAEEAVRFLHAVAAGDRSSGNGGRWTRVAALWWAARQSMSFGGPIEVPTPGFRPRDTEPPPFRVIQGGGRTAPTAQRPPLTVVAS